MPNSQNIGDDWLDDTLNDYLPDVLSMANFAERVGENAEYHTDEPLNRLKQQILAHISKHYTLNSEVEERVDSLKSFFYEWGMICVDKDLRNVRPSLIVEMDYWSFTQAIEVLQGRLIAHIKRKTLEARIDEQTKTVSLEDIEFKTGEGNSSDDYITQGQRIAELKSNLKRSKTDG